MTELYNSHDYCTLAEELEECKRENRELFVDKLNLINAAMDGGDKYHYTAHDIGYRDLERKCKALEVDYAISNAKISSLLAVIDTAVDCYFNSKDIKDAMYALRGKVELE